MAMNVTTITTYPLNGSEREFNITFDYLARRFVKVAVIKGDTRAELTLGIDYRFATATRIRTTVALGNTWERIEIRRETSATDRIVSFSDGSVLRAKDLNASQIQAIHIAEEANDGATLSLSQDDLGRLDAKGRPIINVGEPTMDNDAATKGYVDDLGGKAIRLPNKVPTISGDVRGRLLSFDDSGYPVAVIPSVSSESALASLLKSTKGASEVGVNTGGTVQTELDENRDNLREHWRRSLVEAGITLVNGSFEEGSEVTSGSDAVLSWKKGQCYTFSGPYPKEVVKGSEPKDGWTSVSELSLRAELASSAKGSGADLLSAGKAFTSSIGRTQLSKNAEIVSIMDFHDPSDGIDISFAFDRFKVAINDNTNPLWASNGLKLRIPRGDYVISKPIVINKPGVHIIGDGIQSTRISLIKDLGDSEFLITMTAGFKDYSTVGVCIKDLFINMESKTGGAINLKKPYDGFILENIQIDNLSDKGIGIQVVPDKENNAVDSVSQTLTAINVLIKHSALTATSPCFLLDSLQEAVFINCKAFGGPEEYFNQAPCHGFHFKDCRGISMVGCSIAFTGLHGILFESVNRPSAGLFIEGLTAESLKGILKTRGNSNGDIRTVRVGICRSEGSIENVEGVFYFNDTHFSIVDTSVHSASIASGCSAISVTSFDSAKVNNAGNNCLVVQLPSGAFGGYKLFSESFSIQSGNKHLLDIGEVSSTIYSNGNEMLRVAYPQGEKYSSLSINFSADGGQKMVPVLVGEKDSGGQGFRSLRVWN